MTCQNCARHVREAAQGVAGVASASVDLTNARLRVRWTPGNAAESEVVRAIEEAGFTATAWTGKDTGAGSSGVARAGSEWRASVIGCGGVAVFLALAEWLLGWGHTAWFPWLAAVLAGAVQVLGGARFYRGAWAQWRRRAANMDTLVALGSTAAYGHSLWTLLSARGGHAHFLDSTAIIALISVGHWLEAIASARASGALSALMELAPAKAWRLEPDGSTRDVPAEDVVAGDRVVVGPGERLPADAEVVEGMASVDESMLTGESVPVDRRTGDRVFGGTLNLDGRLVARITASGESTALAGIIAAVERAQNSRADIQRLADRISSIFVPVVVVLALVTAAWWGFAPEWARQVHGFLSAGLWPVALPSGVLENAVSHAVAVLIIACPCAMGLATPIAIMAGANAAALRGILIRDGVALEKAGRIDAVIFDKTGSLTEGRLAWVATEDLRPGGAEREPLEELAASLAIRSTHPVSRALVSARASARSSAEMVPDSSKVGRSAPIGFRLPSVPARGAARSSGGSGLVLGATVPETVGDWTEWREWRGRGIEARAGAAVYRLGSPAWLVECGIHEAGSLPIPSQHAARTVVGIALDDRLLGRLYLSDPLRPEARAVVGDLRHLGFDVGLLSGDAENVVRQVAANAGIEGPWIFAGVRPEAKAETLSRLQREGRRVAFVGDGLNDGPALAQADLGIAVASGTDLARASADVVLLRPGLTGLTEAIAIARRTLRVIRQNLFWAFFYNALAVPLAMLGFFNPILCAAAMGLSDLVVVGNALRLRRSIRRGDAPPEGGRRA